MSASVRAQPSTASDHRPTTSDHRSTTSDHRSTTSDHRSTTSDHRPTALDHRSTTSDNRATLPNHRPTESDHRSTASTKSPRHAVKSPTCAYCGEAITDVVVQAMDNTWHQDHFLCAHCQRPISSQRYHVYDGKSYCEADYSALFLKKCSACVQPIKDVVVMALGRPWHKEHFTCASCSTVLSHRGFYEREAQPYCQECFESKFCPTCHECGKPIIDQAVIALGDKYHVTCFRCGRCNETIMDGSFRIIDAKPVCEKCFDK